jgi:hypothetical protein
MFWKFFFLFLSFFLTYIPFFLCGSRFFYSKDHFKKLNYPGDFKDLAKPSV